MLLRMNPELLHFDYCGQEDDWVWYNLLFFTDNPVAWQTIFCTDHDQY